MIHLHIGRHKTGTSALQQYLHVNRGVLQDLGFHYPRPLYGGRAHHEVAFYLNPTRTARAGGQREVAALEETDHLESQFGLWPNTIVSSEMFQNVKPKDAAKRFPAGQTKVHVYIREQLDYLLSAYAQRIQTTESKTTFTQFSTRFSPEYDKFIGDWAAIYGHDSVNVHLYDRSTLLNGDICQDFLGSLGISEEEFNRFKPLKSKRNPTITPELIEFKGILNNHIPGKIQDDLKVFKTLGKLSSIFTDKLGVSEEFSRSYRSAFIDSNAQVSVAYVTGQKQFQYKSFPSQDRAHDLGHIFDNCCQALARENPDLLSELLARLPSDPVSGLEPLFPSDWGGAVQVLERSRERKRNSGASAGDAPDGKSQAPKALRKPASRQQQPSDPHTS